MPQSEVSLNKKLSLSLYFLILLAWGLFPSLFLLERSGKIDFWWGMCLNLVILIGMSFLFEPGAISSLREDLSTKPAQKIVLGMVSALFLYGFFWVGREVVSTVLSFASREINAIYAFKGEAPNWRIVLSMLLVIGPGEEIFWRGTLQRLLIQKTNPYWGFSLVLLCYTLVHTASFNLTLVGAAFISGFFWGALYWWRGSILVNAISHTIWDILVFLLFPLAFR